MQSDTLSFVLYRFTGAFMQVPLLPFVFAFLAGRVAADLCPPQLWPGTLLLATIGLVLFIIWRRRSRGAQVALLALYTVLGYLAAPPSLPSDAAGFFALNYDAPAVFEGLVNDLAPRSEDKSRVEVEIRARCERNGCQPAMGGVILNWQGPGPSVGRLIRFRTQLKQIEPDGNPDTQDPQKAALRQGIVRRGFVQEGDWIYIERAEIDGGFSRFADSLFRRYRNLRGTIRGRLEAFYLQNAPPESAGLIVGLTLGDRSHITEAVRAFFAAAGLAHLLAISGTHMALVALGAEFLLRNGLLLLPRVRRWPVLTIAPTGAMVPILVYGVLVGITPSIGRAVVMALTVLTLKAFSRKVHTGAVLTLAALLIAVADPQSLWDVGCQLSFVSVLALLTLAPRLQLGARHLLEYLPGQANSLGQQVHKRLEQLLLVMTASTAVTFGTAPLCTYYFHTLSVLGILANVVAVPLLAAISLPVLLCAGILHLASLPGSLVVLAIGSSSVQLGMEVAKFFGDTTRFAPLEFCPTGLQTLLLGLFVVSWLFRRRVRIGLALLTGGLFFLTLWTEGGSPFAAPILRVAQLDVGQGDCLVLHLPDGRVVVLDGGGALASFGRRGQAAEDSSESDRKRPAFDPGRQIIKPYLQRQGYRAIDLMILSHPHPDHLGGLATLVQEMPVREVWVNSLPSGRGAYTEFIDDLTNRGIPITLIDVDTFLPDFGDVRIRCLHPEQGWEARMTTKSGRSTNNGSLVFEVSFGEIDVLLPGDIEKEVEAMLADETLLRRVEVVKVPHHGSETSSSEALVKKTKPRLVMMGVGRDNGFGFPRREVVRRWALAGADIYRTDRDGAIELRIDGHTIDVHTVGKTLGREASYGAFDDQDDVSSRDLPSRFL